MKKIKLLLVLLLMITLSIIVGCAKTKYVVSFNTDSDQTIASQEVIENEKATKPEDPIKEGHKFTGWFNGEIEYTFEEAVTANIELKAKWEICIYTVTFDTGTEDKIDSQEIKYDKKASQPANPSKEGYLFGGWYNGDAKYDFNAPVKSDLNLVAKWNEIPTYEITFVAEGKTVTIIEVEEGKDAPLPEAPAIEGKTFLKWDGKYTSVTEDAEVIAVYTINKYRVEFKVDGVTYGDIQEVEHGKDCPAPTNPEKEGYKFVGWDAEFTAVKGDLVINAKFEALEYTIKYYSGTTEITNLDPVKYTSADTITLTDYELSGYYFYAWYNNSDLSGDPIYTIEAGTSGDITLYALNVKADINGGADCWTTNFPETHDASDGISAISNLPAHFEMDFFKYLSDNNLLKDARVNSTCVADTWAAFSGINPNHNGDPKRIWNDTSTNASGSADGYVALFLYETLELNTDMTVSDVKGGFLGTEPYKTKYRGLLDSLVIMYQYKVENSNYTEITQNTNGCRALMGFVIDGYFYGTQGAGSSYLKAIRSVIPGITFGYRLNGETVEQFNYETNALPTPVKDGYVFAGWCLDKAGTQLLGEHKATNLCTIYAKWEEIK